MKAQLIHTRFVWSVLKMEAYMFRYILPNLKAVDDAAAFCSYVPSEFGSKDCLTYAYYHLTVSVDGLKQVATYSVVGSISLERAIDALSFVRKQLLTVCCLVSSNIDIGSGVQFKRRCLSSFHQFSESAGAGHSCSYEIMKIVDQT